eukprot:scpid28321/ scgid2435/ Uncharacterized glycosidase Rv0584
MARSKDIAIVAHSVAMVVVLSFVMLPSGTGQVVSQSLTVLNAGTDSDDADNAGQRRSVDPPNLPFSSKVNMLVGTGGDGFGVGGDPPGVQVPFGALRLSPDTALDNVAFGPHHFGGYHHSDNEIRCFSHTHMVGPGVLDFGNIGTMATRSVQSSMFSNYGYRSKFKHANETAMPGYYRVLLDDAQVIAELTACGSHAGIHRYSSTGSMPASHDQPMVILFDPSHALTPGGCNGSFVEYNHTTQEVTGWMLNQGSLTRRNGHGVYIYFAARMSAMSDDTIHGHGIGVGAAAAGIPVVSSYGTWNTTGVYNGSASSSAEGAASNGFFITVSQDIPVEISIAISFISMKQARANLDQQVDDRTFDKCCAATRQLWEDNLAKVNVTGRDSANEAKFYTALYHSFMAPTNYAEAGGVYLGVDGQVHSLEAGQDAMYSDMSIWDIHRTQASLLAWLQPQVFKDITTSMVNMMAQGGDLPRWPIANVYAGCMIGNHGFQILLDGLVKNYSHIDVGKVYATMKLEATSVRPHNGRDDLYNYVTRGYCIGGHKNSSVSKTLAYAYDDWAISEFASILGLTADAELFRNHSKNYRNLWDAGRKLMCGRDGAGEFHCPLDPELNEWVLESTDFTEGNAAQWRWFVPHDVPGLVQLFGGSSEFSKALDGFMEGSHRHPSNLLPNPYYWAGNEPDILAPYLFNYAAGSEYLTQKVIGLRLGMRLRLRQYSTSVCKTV